MPIVSKLWEPQLPGALGAYLGLCRDEVVVVVVVVFVVVFVVVLTG